MCLQHDVAGLTWAWTGSWRGGGWVDKIPSLGHAGAEDRSIKRVGPATNTAYRTGTDWYWSRNCNFAPRQRRARALLGCPGCQPRKKDTSTTGTTLKPLVKSPPVPLLTSLLPHDVDHRPCRPWPPILGLAGQGKRSPIQGDQGQRGLQRPLLHHEKPWVPILGSIRCYPGPCRHQRCSRKARRTIQESCWMRTRSPEGVTEWDTSTPKKHQGLAGPGHGHEHGQENDMGEPRCVRRDIFRIQVPYTSHKYPYDFLSVIRSAPLEIPLSTTTLPRLLLSVEKHGTITTTTTQPIPHRHVDDPTRTSYWWAEKREKGGQYKQSGARCIFSLNPWYTLPSRHGHAVATLGSSFLQQPFTHPDLESPILKEPTRNAHKDRLGRNRTTGEGANSSI